ncbi:putative TIM-barrel fold metal-dependent hydrolase [Williamsia limnetica]|uniref:Putative TIM-barrel fold metal-dependent hydrolase n=1 Tax=Williamsia limnetica TaxID=882452 RepID=A0A318RTY5_WILLI|nr:amidohydrolase family protein [Williamsia limnetica]PYE19478.1 putative TIM-barrel fold metal-dependent hydrolase [Williamsia limnetica]
MSTPVVDAHVHLWEVSRRDWYPGLEDFATSVGTDLYRDFLIDDYRSAAGDFDVKKFVHVSAVTKPGSYLDETEWIDAYAGERDLDLVIIGSVDPTLAAGKLMTDLERQAASTRFRGVRVLYGLQPGSEAAKTVLSWLQAHNFIFEVSSQSDTAADWIEILRRYPELDVVVEHTGWPVGTDPFSRSTWEAAVSAYATETNALCKISGLGMTTRDLSAAVLRPWIEKAIDVFGWDRVAFGSNIPIEHMAGDYAQLQESLETIIGGAAEHEQVRFYSANAERVYKF